MAYNSKMSLTTLVVTLLSLLFAKPTTAANQTAKFLSMRNNNITSWNQTTDFSLLRSSHARHLIHGDRGDTGFHYCYTHHFHNPKKHPTRIDTLNIDHISGKISKIYKGTTLGFEFKITPSEDILEGTQLWPDFKPWVMDSSDFDKPPTGASADAIDVCSLVDCPVPAGQQMHFTAKVLIPNSIRTTTGRMIFGSKLRFQLVAPVTDVQDGHDRYPFDVLQCVTHHMKVDDMRVETPCEVFCA
ncbi:uncharacterized protein MYCFIDRAFT_215925 [Pseudocercospora fijiensis CIRAD86]|uniref:Phosphatidylglycerol/phosphatidylinositol transfer protein n=1 Tax=Pseudocercospora fijiensis (strain CIRAD86) TaxID=383855 RepID=M3AW33_PSEFD|nr:uncharacterized protein MYCFIDRAFT_215925 [Pseudocercospora fijiensis CIRAD86]EME81328.1 hypothetical protein MYCFIDRAFT_215925 [Pseudocercospora fijiensis CIRAD86]